jgi:CRISPR-associated protein Cas5d
MPQLAHSKVYLRTWGQFGCFTRPELKVERVTYSVPTPSAARGILEAILFRPQFRWCIHRIAVHKPIRFIGLCRNEVKMSVATRRISAWMGGVPPDLLVAEEQRTQRHTLALWDVSYTLEASLVRGSHLSPGPATAHETASTDVLFRYHDMFIRRAGLGQCVVQPCFGCREFPAFFELADETAMQVQDQPNADCDLGLMIYDVFDLDGVHAPFTSIEPMPKRTVFHAKLLDGTVSIPAWEEMRKQIKQLK